MKFNLTAPCKDCPFRTDKPFFLSEERAKEIVHALVEEQQTFQCHKTIDYNRAEQEDGSVDSLVAAQNKNAQHCAGALIMLEHMERPNQWMRIGERIGIYDRRKLKMDAPVFKSGDEFIELQRQLEKGETCQGKRRRNTR